MSVLTSSLFAVKFIAPSFKIEPLLVSEVVISNCELLPLFCNIALLIISLTVRLPVLTIALEVEFASPLVIVLASKVPLFAIVPLFVTLLALTVPAFEKLSELINSSPTIILPCAKLRIVFVFVNLPVISSLPEFSTRFVFSKFPLTIILLVLLIVPELLKSLI